MRSPSTLWLLVEALSLLSAVLTALTVLTAAGQINLRVRVLPRLGTGTGASGGLIPAVGNSEEGRLKSLARFDATASQQNHPPSPPSSLSVFMPSLKEIQTLLEAQKSLSRSLFF